VEIRVNCNACGYGDCFENDTRSIREIEKIVETPCPQCGNTVGPKTPYADPPLRGEPFYVVFTAETDAEHAMVGKLGDSGCVDAWYWGERVVGLVPYLD